MSVNISSDGSPTPRKGPPRFPLPGDNLKRDTSPDMLGLGGGKRPNSTTQDKGTNSTTLQRQSQLPRLANHQASFKKQRVDGSTSEQNPSLVDTLSQRLDEQTGFSLPQAFVPSGRFDNTSGHNGPKDGDSPSSEPVSGAVVADNHLVAQGADPASTEVLQLKKELEMARGEVARMKQELHASAITTSTLNQAQSSDTDFNYYQDDVTDQTISKLQNAFNAVSRPAVGRQDSWTLQEEIVADNSDPLLTKAFSAGNIWGSGARPAASFNAMAPVSQQYPAPTNNWNDASRSLYNNGTMAVGVGISGQGFGSHQTSSRSSNGNPAVYRGRNQFLNEPAHFPLDQTFRGGIISAPPSRPGSAFEQPRYSQYPGFPNPMVPGHGVGSVSPSPDPMTMPPVGLYNPAHTMFPRAASVGNRLSPEAAEFNVDALVPSPWNSQPISDSGSQYVAPVEPMNYRRLLDRNMNCNWKYIVDKIICNNDQQASIFLQQKLKVGTTEQKFEIVDAIIAQAYPLMINRFGNFLVQRCFEHGTPEQVVAIANAIRGNTLTLSMDPFGCHVIQKAFDCVPEEYKATMVHELLRRIPETVIHRYACHVWQKLFELRWSDAPPQIMRYVNEALRGMWHEVALGETGSLVVQNIFENCLEEDKRPCINEVLASIDVISHGQFGNWCIQHICEHGAPADRSRAIDHILRFATEYSMDQYASKVIEKCLKIGGNEFLDRYLERVCEGRPDRPRMPLIDIAGDQFGNYLIQYILTNASTHHRELVASHVRKHMVSLRGSKYGSRVAMLCCNPAVTTRPGPPSAIQLGRYGTRNGSAYSTFR